MKIEKAAKIENFFMLDTVSLAKELLGKLIIVKNAGKILSGYIVETEAYLGVIDEACHGYKGKRTPKVEALYQKAGTVYIYTMHTHKMLNIVSCEKNNPQAVLIRGIEPLKNREIMEENRGKTGVIVSNGPGKLTKAMGINDKFNMSEVKIISNGTYLKKADKNTDKSKVNKKLIYENIIKKSIIKENTIYLDFNDAKNPEKIEISPRIGIPNKGKWTDELLRFYVAGNKYVSGMKKSEYTDKCWKSDD